MLTFLPLELIQDIMGRKPGAAQELLAFEICELVYGAQPTQTLQSEIIRVPRSTALGTTYPKLLHHAGLVSSISEGTRLVANGGLYVADNASGSFMQVRPAAEVPSLPNGTSLVLRLGKWRVRTIELFDEDDGGMNNASTSH